MFAEQHSREIKNQTFIELMHGTQCECFRYPTNIPSVFNNLLALL